jgi:hypothetical protein
MKIIWCEKGGDMSYRYPSVNFVDDNNVLVGYDMDADCCEDFGWYFEFPDGSRSDPDEENIDLDGFQFDPKFCELRQVPKSQEGGGEAIFKLTKGDKEIKLVLFNYHNGYYSHGFEMKVDGEVIESGNL